MGKKRWRFFGVFVFGFFAFMELGDLFGMISGSRSGPGSSALPGALPGEGTLRLVILAVLAFGIVIASLATASALLTGASWGRYSAFATAALFFIYGAVQIIGGFLIESSKTGLIFAGIMYLLLGVVANWIGGMAQLSPRKTP